MFDYDAASEHVRACHRGQQAAAEKRCQVRRGMPHASGVEGLHFHKLWAQVKR